MKSLRWFLILSILLTYCSFLSLGFAQDVRLVKDITFDRTSGTITYTLSKPSWIRIRLGIKDGPMHYAFDWQKEAPGKHIKQWDGLDESKEANLLDDPRCIFSLNYFTDNPQDEMIDLEQTINYDNFAFIGRVPKRLVFTKLYRAHHLDTPYEPRVELTFADNVARTEEGFPILRAKDIIPIVIKLSEKDKQWFRRERFAVQIFIDGVFVSGEPEGYTPYTYNFNPRGINEGKHQLVVNLKGLYDHIGWGKATLVIKN